MRYCANIVSGWRPGKPKRCTTGGSSWLNRSSESSRSNWEPTGSCCVALPTCRLNGRCWPLPSTCVLSGRRGALDSGSSLNRPTAWSLAPLRHKQRTGQQLFSLQPCVPYSTWARICSAYPSPSVISASPSSTASHSSIHQASIHQPLTSGTSSHEATASPVTRVCRSFLRSGRASAMSVPCVGRQPTACE